MRWPRRAHNAGPYAGRNANARSPPSAASVTIETPQQRNRRVQNEDLTRRVQAFSRTHQVCLRVPLFFTPSGQPRPVEEVAKELVGHFLICRESNVVVRIVETEAYQEREEIFRNRFRDPPPDFRSPAGVLISSALPFGQQLMFITAGDNDSGDLVLLRTCSPIHGSREIARRLNLSLPLTRDELINLMAGPTRVAAALAPELGSYCSLLIPTQGLHLVQKDPNPLIMLDGPRMLPRDTRYISYSTMRGANRRFRFAYDCPQKILLRSSLRRIENQP